MCRQNIVARTHLGRLSIQLAVNGLKPLQISLDDYFVDKENFVGHVYYGKKLRDANIAYLLRTGEGPFVPSENNRERVSFYDTFPMEYAGNGLGDYRRSSISVRTEGGHTAESSA